MPHRLFDPAIGSIVQAFVFIGIHLGNPSPKSHQRGRARPHGALLPHHAILHLATLLTRPALSNFLCIVPLPLDGFWSNDSWGYAHRNSVLCPREPLMYAYRAETYHVDPASHVRTISSIQRAGFTNLLRKPRPLPCGPALRPQPSPRDSPLPRQKHDDAGVAPDPQCFMSSVDIYVARQWFEPLAVTYQTL